MCPYIHPPHLLYTSPRGQRARPDGRLAKTSGITVDCTRTCAPRGLPHQPAPRRHPTAPVARTIKLCFSATAYRGLTTRDPPTHPGRHALLCNDHPCSSRRPSGGPLLPSLCLTATGQEALVEMMQAHVRRMPLLLSLPGLSGLTIHEYFAVCIERLAQFGGTKTKNRPLPRVR